MGGLRRDALLKDSIQVTYTSPDGTTWQAADSVVFTYSTVGTTDLQTSTFYQYTTSWQPYQRQRLWFNAGRLDSVAVDTFNVNTNSWVQIAKGWNKYVGALLDSVRVHANLSGGALAIYLQKLSYDAASRPNYLRDNFVCEHWLQLPANPGLRRVHHLYIAY